MWSPSSIVVPLLLMSMEQFRSIAYTRTLRTRNTHIRTIDSKCLVDIDSSVYVQDDTLSVRTV